MRDPYGDKLIERAVEFGIGVPNIYLDLVLSSEVDGADRGPNIEYSPRSRQFHRGG